MSLILEELSLSIQGKRLVRDISLNVKRGEVVGLLGPNGAGKTTTFNLTIGQFSPDKGKVKLDDDDVTNLSTSSRARKGIGYLPQEPSIFRQLTVSENLEIPLSFYYPSIVRRRARKEQLVNQFNLSSFLNTKGFQLSGGERRRSEVARALASGNQGPNYLLLDEPFAGIDPLAVSDLQDLIQKLKANNMGILITDHNVRETLAITDRSYILSEGKILASGSSFEISNNPLVKRYYLGEGFKL